MLPNISAFKRLKEVMSPNMGAFKRLKGVMSPNMSAFKRLEGVMLRNIGVLNAWMGHETNTFNNLLYKNTDIFNE